MNSREKYKILIIRFSSIGDIVLTTPVVRCLKQQLGAEIHYLTKYNYRQILDPNPHVDQVFTIQSRVGEVLSKLKMEKYDFIVDLHRNLRSRKVKTALHTRHKSFNKINLQKWLIVNLKVDRLPRVHIVDRYLDTVRGLHVENDGYGLDYFIRPEDELDLSTLSLGAPYLAFVIGAAHKTKCLPAEKIIRICQSSNFPIALLGGPGEKELGEVVAQKSGLHVHNFCGQFNLGQSASLVKQARRVITHDTGLMHIAAAFEKDIVSIWGNTIPDFGMYPYNPENSFENKMVEIDELPCRPCSKIGYDSCPKKHFNCMKQIDESRIIDLLN